MSLGKTCYSLYSCSCSTDLQNHSMSTIFISSERRMWFYVSDQ